MRLFTTEGELALFRSRRMNAKEKAIALIPWLFIWTKEERHLVLKNLDPQIIRVMIRNEDSIDRSTYKKVMKVLEESFQYRTFKAGDPAFGEVTHKNALEVWWFNVNAGRESLAVTKFFEWALTTNEEIGHWEICVALKKGADIKHPLLSQVANYILTNRPEVVEAMYDRGYTYWLCVDGESFRKLTFFYSLQDTTVHRSTVLNTFSQASRICPNEARALIFSYARYIYASHLPELITRIELPRELDCVKQYLSIKSAVMYEALPKRELIHPANLSLYDDLEKKGLLS